MDNSLNSANCPVCLDKLKVGQKFKYIEDYKIDNQRFSLSECPLCRVKFWYPFRNPGPEWYKNCDQNLMHRSFENKEYFLWLAENRGITKHFLNNPPHENPKGLKLLDVGCGTGGFLIEAEKLGYKVTGVDFDDEQIKIAKRFGLNDVYVGDVINFLNVNQGKYDVITGFEIIEHLDKPREFLRAIHGALKPDGYLCLSTPNSSRIGPRNEFWDFPYHHLTRWTKRSLRNIVEMENFKSIKIKEELPISFLISKTRVGLGAFLRKKMVKKSETDVSQSKQYKDTVAKLGSIKDRVLSFFLLPLAMVAYIFGKKGQGMYLTTRK